MDKNTLHLEQMYLGEREVPPEIDAAVKNEFTVIAASNEEILSKYSAAEMKKKILAKMQQNATTEKESEKQPALRFPVERTVGKKIRQFSFVAAAACFLLAIPVIITNVTGNGSFETGRIRAKGDARLFVYRQTGSEAERLSSGAASAAGDVIQISYVAAGAKYGVIISIDGNGVITRHFPDGGHIAGKLVQGREIPLPFSYKLDDAPDYERFILFYSDKPFPISVLASMENGFIDGSNGRDFDFSTLMPRSVSISDFLLSK